LPTEAVATKQEDKKGLEDYDDMNALE